MFPNFTTKETLEKFRTWGITEEYLDVAKFRFNKTFHLIGAEEFLTNMLNSAEVVKAFKPLSGLTTVSEIKYTQMNCNVLNMSYFEIFDTLDLVTSTGSIRGNYEERYMGIVLGDKLR